MKTSRKSSTVTKKQATRPAKALKTSTATIAKTPKQKIVVIYHGDCPDGFGGAYAAWKKFKNTAAYLPAKNRLALPCPLKNKEIYLIDYTYKEDLIQQLIKDNVRVTAIDHHISSEAAVKMTDDYLFDLNHSGAVLAWNYFHPKKKVPLFLKYVEDKDLWHWKMPASHEIAAYTNLFKKDFLVWDKIVNDIDTVKGKKHYKEEGELLLRYEHKIIEDIVKDAETVKFMGYTIFAVDAPGHFIDEVGNLLAEKTGTISIVWRKLPGRTKVSLRGVDPTIDASRMAVKFNGGGHKSAASFFIDDGEKLPWKVLKNS